MSEWQPIETAPQFTYVILGNNGGVMGIAYKNEDSRWQGYFAPWTDWGCVQFSENQTAMTHWLPLPNPPEIK